MGWWPWVVIIWLPGAHSYLQMQGSLSAPDSFAALRCHVTQWIKPQRLLKLKDVKSCVTINHVLYELSIFPPWHTFLSPQKTVPTMIVIVILGTSGSILLLNWPKIARCGWPSWQHLHRLTSSSKLKKAGGKISSRTVTATRSHHCPCIMTATRAALLGYNSQPWRFPHPD